MMCMINISMANMKSSNAHFYSILIGVFRSMVATQHL